MKVHTIKETTKHTIIRDLKDNDTVFLKVHDVGIGLKYNVLTASLDFYLEGSLMDKPFFQISRSDLETLEFSANPQNYVSIGFRGELYGEVRKRLQGLPIVLPIEVNTK